MRMTAILDAGIVLCGNVRVHILEAFGNIPREFRPDVIALRIGVGVHLPIHCKTNRFPW